MKCEGLEKVRRMTAGRGVCDGGLGYCGVLYIGFIGLRSCVAYSKLIDETFLHDRLTYMRKLHESKCGLNENVVKSAACRA